MSNMSRAILVRLSLAVGLFCLVGWTGSSLRGDDAPAKGAPAQETLPKEAPAAEGAASDAAPGAPGEAAPVAGLSSSQESLQRQYKRFEEGLYRIAEGLRKSDPERADLLLRAIGKSKEERIGTQMSELATLLRGQKLGDAIERQEDLIGNLQTILDLLLSEDRQKELKDEQKRIKAYLEEVNKLIGKEKGNRADNERGVPLDDVEAQQKKIQDQTDALQRKINKDDEAKAAKSQSKSGDSGAKSPNGKPTDPMPGDKSGEKNGDKSGDKPGEDKPGDKSGDKNGDKSGDKSGEKKEGDTPAEKSGEKSGEKKEGDKPGDKSRDKPGDKSGEAKPGEPKEGEGKPSEGKPSEGEPQEGKPQSGQPQPGQPQQGQPGQSGPKTPGREELERAKEAMERAIENLKKNKRHDASDDQDDALAELQRAKDKLEEILRQLREEEKERFLAMLEARFQRMLTMQLLVYDGTIKLSRTSAADRAEKHSARALQLARQEDEIALEATKAVTLLREEGTAVAFPEAVEMMRDDMRHVSRRLEKTDVGEVTQAVEKDIIDALEEMIDALQKEMEKSKKKDKQQQQQQDQQQQDPELVDKLAELKMLRTLQLRINNRTRRLGREVDGEQAKQAEVVDQLQELAERQARVQKATYDIATGRNK